MTLLPAKIVHLVEQAESYLISVYLFHSALAERKPRGRFHPPPPPAPLYNGEVRVS